MRISDIFREHWRFLIGFPMLMIVMTWPTIIYVFDFNVAWLPAISRDIWMKFWDAWRLPFILADSRNYLFTDLLFYPDGLSLVYHNFSFPHMIVFGALQNIMPASNAFNLSFLLIVAANGMAAYVFLLRLFRNLWLGFVGAVIFALSPFALSQPQHPDVIFVAVVPLSLYFLDRGLLEGKWQWIGLSGLCIAFTLYIGMYIYVCLVLTVGLFLLGYAKQFWPSHAFWRRVILLALIVGSVSFIRVYPLIENSSSFSEALGKTGGEEQGNDLLASFVNPQHPLLPSEFRAELASYHRTMNDGSYLGFVPLLLVIYGLLRGSNRSSMAPWLVLLLLFSVLRLGSNLVVFGQQFDHFILPKFFLDQLLPFLFESFWDTSNFHIGVTLPLAVLTCFGLMSASQLISRKYRLTFIWLALLATAFEFYQPMQSQIIPSDGDRFLTWLRMEDDQDKIRLVHLPMGRHESKFYGYIQSLSGYPHVEGLASRTPSSAYDSINSNIILSTWRRDKSIRCLPATRERYLPALNQLLADNISHIIAHKSAVRISSILPSFHGIAPAYEDRFVRIYRLASMRDSCSSPSISLPDPFAHIADLARSPSITAAEGMSILSFHPAAGMDNETLDLLSSVFLYWKQFAHVHLADGEPQLQTLNTSESDLNAFLGGEGLILLLHNPRQTGRAGLGALDDALAAGFHACRPVIDSANLVAAYYLPAGFDCALLLPDAALTVDYDNGVRLANALLESDGDQLDIATWWNRLPGEAHGVSIQIFDAAGAKAASGDFVIHHESLVSHRLDLSPLEPGEYRVKLILYNYQSGGSIAGSVSGSQLRFDRELDIGSITLG